MGKIRILGFEFLLFTTLGQLPFVGLRLPICKMRELEKMTFQLGCLQVLNLGSYLYFP